MDEIRNYIDGVWQNSSAVEHLDVTNPATGETLGRVPLSTPGEVDQAAQAAAGAFVDWRRTPVVDRVQYLFKLKYLLDENFEELSRTITLENGKTLGESRGEYNSEDIARGIDEIMIRQPIGAAAAICPFNFPGMIPFWFMPYALACGNTYVVKPSEKVPLTMVKVFELLEEVGFPKGVVNMINGSKDTVGAILEHPTIRAISFVGSTPVAKHVYAQAAANGKRAQVQGGAKNPIIVLADADMDMSTRIVADSAFGNAGQRCLAASLAVTVGEASNSFTEAIAEAATQRVVGYGLDDGVDMGPVITPESKARIQSLIREGEAEGARVLVDGRDPKIDGYEKGNFIGPTVLEGVPGCVEIFKTEIFGPVLGLMHVDTIEDAIELVNTGNYGNMASLFTSSGAAARKFRYEAEAGNIGINIGVAAPMAFFPFSGWRDSFFGVLHGQGRDAVEFFTQEKVVVERWPKDWSRKF
jgi:malonate-semialdehyde dehydrogenase (acetylating)/methylmalonate-semialdehyde dehydrogenase